MLFDRDEDGVLSFQELQVVMKSMGQRPSGERKVYIAFLIIGGIKHLNMELSHISILW